MEKLHVGMLLAYRDATLHGFSCFTITDVARLNHETQIRTSIGVQQA